MGDTGPCGRCSEIHYFRGNEIPCPEPVCLGVECSCERYVEVWNNVFMEFNRAEGGTLTPLPAPSIDTGMGLERITAVIQGKLSNYDTDLFTPILSAIGQRAGRTYAATAGVADHPDVSMRVIADHLRAMTFLIADGVLPSNEWRGYVLRKIMRRAMRHGKKLGLSDPFLRELVDVVVGEMGGAYPELNAARDADQEDRSRRGRPFRRRADVWIAETRGADRSNGGRRQQDRAWRRRVPVVRLARRSSRFRRGPRRAAWPGRRPVRHSTAPWRASGSVRGVEQRFI